MVWDGLGRKCRMRNAERNLRKVESGKRNSQSALGGVARGVRAAVGARRSAFSLPELMIALVILALGLLIIAAALPVGLSYTQESVNLTNAEIGGEFALDSIEEYLQLWDLGNVPYSNDRFNPIFRPYDGTRYSATYEPLIKVHPFVASNLEPRRSGGAFTEQPDKDGERVISNWVSQFGIAANDTSEFDYRLLAGFVSDSSIVFSLEARVYPPLASPIRRYPNGWLNLPMVNRYDDPTLSQSEFDEAVTRQVLWTAFYRRVSYDQPGPDLLPGSPDDVKGDASLYEVVVVVVRRPSERHRFALQEIGSAGTPPVDDPRAKTTGTGGLDRIAPVPWLVSFDSSLPVNVALPIPEIMTYHGFGEDPRIPNPNSPIPAHLTFKCKSSVGRLLPVGSIFIPARNDIMPTHMSVGGVFRNVGFAPYDPHALPIYRVIERPDDTTVVVENNGVYPWMVQGGAAPDNTAMAWPVWVIPPAHVERDSSGQPVFDSRTSVIGVSRRYVRLPEFKAPQ